MTSPTALRGEAEREAARLPTLLAQAHTLAATVQAGAHGRRREGEGDAFWSYRSYRPGDEPRRIDWRRSARGDEVLVREREQAVAATVRVWPDRRPGMRWRSSASVPTKADRATVLALGLASLLGRGGERCGLFGGPRPASGLQAATRLAEALSLADEDARPAPAGGGGPRVLITDAVSWSDDRLGAGAGVLLRISDPAEVEFPYTGGVVFGDLGGGAERRLGRAEAVRSEYVAARRAHAAAVDAAAASAGLRVLDHRTDQPAATALLALWRAVAGAG